MSDKNIIGQNNGRIVTVKSVFCSTRTCLLYAKNYLKLLKQSPEYGSAFQNDNADYEINMLPIGVRDLSILSKDFKFTKDRANYCRSIGNLESMITAAERFDPSNHENELYYRSFYPIFSDTVIKSLTNADGTVKLLSGGSFWRLDRPIVNALLGKTPSGIDINTRRRKHKGFDEFGEPIYFTNEEIRLAEIEARARYKMHENIQINVDYNPFIIENIFLTIASSVYADEKPFNFIKDKFDPFSIIHPIDNIFSNKDDISCYLGICEKINCIFLSDFQIVKGVMDGTGDILTSLDILDNARSSKKADTRMKFHSIYITLMRQVNLILPFAVKFIRVILDNDQGGKFDEKFGYKLSDDPDPELPNLFFNSLLNEDSPLVPHINSLIINPDSADPSNNHLGFNLTGPIFRNLFIYIVKCCTNNTKGNKNIALLSKKFGHGTSHMLDTTIKESFFKRLNCDNNASFSYDMIDRPINDKGENLVSYLYRSLQKCEEKDLGNLVFLSRIVLIFTEELKNDSFINELRDNPITIDIDGLITTVNKITGKEYNLTTPIFEKINKIIESNATNSNDSLKLIDTELDNLYGKKYKSRCVPLPPIEFSLDDLKWLKRKTQIIKGKIDNITTKKVNFERLYELYSRIQDFVYINNQSDVENPKIIEQINAAEAEYNNFLSQCTKIENGNVLLTTGEYETYRKLQGDLYYYSHPEQIRFEFIPFEFKTKSGIGSILSFNIKHCYLKDGEDIKRGETLYASKGEEWIKSYFDPFFRPFATIAVEAFKIEVEQKMVPKKGKPDILEEVLLINVTYGSNQDTHTATKFRTNFPSISDIDFLLAKAKMLYGNGSVDYDISMINPLDFKIKWFKTLDQHRATSGESRETTFKIYDDYEGCFEEYPFYDASGRLSISNEFARSNESYLNKLNRTKNIDAMRIEREKVERVKREVDNIIREHVNDLRRKGKPFNLSLDQKNDLLEEANKQRRIANERLEDGDKILLLPLFKDNRVPRGPDETYKISITTVNSRTLWSNFKTNLSNGQEVSIGDVVKSTVVKSNVPSRSVESRLSGRGGRGRDNNSYSERYSNRGVNQQPNVINHDFIRNAWNIQQKERSKPDQDGFVTVANGRKIFNGRIVTGNTPNHKSSDQVKDNRFTNPINRTRYNNNNGKRAGGRSQSPNRVKGSNSKLHASSSPQVNKRGFDAGINSPNSSTPIDDKMRGSNGYLQPQNFNGIQRSASPTASLYSGIFSEVGRSSPTPPPMKKDISNTSTPRKGTSNTPTTKGTNTLRKDSNQFSVLADNGDLSFNQVINDSDEEDMPGGFGVGSKSPSVPVGFGVVSKSPSIPDIDFSSDEEDMPGGFGVGSKSPSIPVGIVVGSKSPSVPDIDFGSDSDSDSDDGDDIFGKSSKTHPVPDTAPIPDIDFGNDSDSDEEREPDIFTSDIFSGL